MSVLLRRIRCLAVLAGVLLIAGVGFAQAEKKEDAEKPPQVPYTKGASFGETLQATRVALAAAALEEKSLAEQTRELWRSIRLDFPIESDWALQDGGVEFPKWLAASDDATSEAQMVATVVGALGPEGASLNLALERLCAAKTAPGDPAWFDLYARACEERRAVRLRPLQDKWSRIVFTKHYDLGGSHYAYTEGQSDAQSERHFTPGTALCVLETQGVRPVVRTLIDDPNGVIRDPDVSYDGKRILFAWKKSDLEDDYHLYEMDVESGNVRQLTFGLGFADYEGCYLPNGDILFNSSRCVQIVDCWWTEVSNLYTCDKDGKFLRRLSFDQVHTNFPTVTEDGRVLYTRWDYNDRGQLFPQPLFQMLPDGTAQTECYGNNAWFPTTIMHARSIPGTQSILAVLSGHHSDQRGKLAIIDPRKGRQENEGVQLIAPVRETPPERIDAYGQDGDQFQYPYPMSDREFLVTYCPEHGGNRGYPYPYAIYLMDVDGQRELLAADPKISCNQPIPLAPRPTPHPRPSRVDYGKDSGAYYVQDVYVGPGLEGIERGTVKRLRVIALDFRAAGIGNNGNGGPAGGALVSTPVSINNGTWDVKSILGETDVYEDGSVFFTVPARTPVYFQLIDAKGHAVQSMRSWSTLQPGETFSCVGCHESKNGAPARTPGLTQAMRAGAQVLEPFYGAPRGFSFLKEIQPILDRNCIECHKDRSLKDVMAAKEARQAGRKDSASFSLLGEQTVDAGAKRKWSDSYLALTQRGNPNPAVNWLNVQSVPPMLPPYYRGSSQSALMSMLEKGHGKTKLSKEELDKIAAWIDLLVPYCGDYAEANAWSDAEMEKHNRYMEKRKRMEEIERKNIEELLVASQGS